MAKALRSVPPGESLFLLGNACLTSKKLLVLAGRVAKRLGASLMVGSAFARIERGAGIPHCTRVPYFPSESQKELNKYKQVKMRASGEKGRLS